MPLITLATMSNPIIYSLSGPITHIEGTNIHKNKTIERNRNWLYACVPYFPEPSDEYTI